MQRMIFALAALCLMMFTGFISEGQARPRHAGQAIVTCDARGCSDWSASAVSAERATPSRIGRMAVADGEGVSRGGRPSHCPSRWCGCWLADHLGMADRTLWRAVEWAKRGRPAGGPQVGAVAVWRHHVGKITAVEGNKIRVLSGNDGNSVRDRWRTTQGVVAYRFI